MPQDGFFDRRTDDEVFNTPQKKYIRHEVWGKYARIRKEKSTSDFVRYLTFPAEGCYDIKILEGMGLLKTVQIDGKTKYKSVGFCETDSEKFARIQQKLPDAKHHNGEYEELVGAYDTAIPDKAQRWFPFDVINLDFTSPLFYWKYSVNKEKVTNSILRTFQIQKIRRTSFTLFLTLPARKDDDVLRGKEKLDNIVKENLGNPRQIQFKERFFEKYNVNLSTYIFDQIDYREYLLMSIPKMVINMGIRESFDVVCCERFSYKGDHYDGRSNLTNMLTFVFECEIVGNPDGYSGINPVEILNDRYPRRVLDYFTSTYTVINDLFESDNTLKTRYIGITY